MDSRLGALVEARTGWLDAATARFASDRRILAAWLTGSIGRGEGDAWSDVDTTLVVPDGVSREVLATPADAEAHGDLLFWVDCPHNAPPGGKQVLTRYAVGDHLVMADLNVWPASFARRPADCVDLIEPRFSAAPTAATTREIVAGAERPAAPRYSVIQRAEWVACMIHVAAAFPPRGHDAARMLDLIGAAQPAETSPSAQLDALRARMASLRPQLTPRALDASMRRLDLAASHVNK